MRSSQQVGGINRKRFIKTEDTVRDILKQRLKGEKNVGVRKHLRQKIELFS